MKNKILKLTIPKHGWCTLSISYWHDRASYLTSLPIDLLDAMISLLRDRKVSTIYCDAEGWDYYIIFDFFEITIVKRKDTNKLYTYPYNYKMQANYLYNTISANINAWSQWEVNFNANSSEGIKENLVYKRKIENLLAILKDYLKEC